MLATASSMAIEDRVNVKAHRTGNTGTTKVRTPQTMLAARALDKQSASSTSFDLTMDRKVLV